MSSSTFEQSGDQTLVREWRTQLRWVDPGEFRIDESELQWERLTRSDSQRSFDALARIAPHLRERPLESDPDRKQAREELANLRSDDGEPEFDDADLRFYDLYFGESRIVVDRVEDGYSITNGRHRLLMAQKEGIRALPMWVNERTGSSGSNAAGGESMSRMELSELQDEAKEQKERAEGLENEATEHKEQISELEKNVRELKAMMSEMSSDQIRQAESSLEEAKRDVEKKLEENREEKQRLETRNTDLREKLTDVNSDRRRATTRLGVMQATFSKASDAFKGQIKESIDSLNDELRQLADVEEDLIAAKQRLDSIDI